MTVRQIYRKYRIFAGLQLHQLRVAAVAKYICDRCKNPIDIKSVIAACLFHDMGNIIKADLRMPELLEPEGIEYWRKVKEDFHGRYGDDEHDATEKIMREIGMPEDPITLVNDMGFSQLRAIIDSENLKLHILQYADMRVGPFGILPLEERLREGRARYKARVGSIHPYANDARFENFLGEAKELEKLLTQHADFKSDDITDMSMAPIIEELWDYSVQ